MIEITTAESKDAECIIDLQRLAYQSEAILYNDWSLPALTQTLDSLLKEFEISVVLKATMNGRIIGSVRATVEEDVCKIGRLIVDPEFQRQGIGSKLLKHIEKMHKSASVFELFTGSKSIGNIRLYESHGYVVSHTQALSDKVGVTFLAKPNEIL